MPLEYSVGSLICTIASRLVAVMVGWPGAAQDRNLALTLDQRLEDIRFVIRDRGSNFTASSDAVFQAEGTGARILRTAVRVPRMNAICERMVGAALQLAVTAA